MPQAIKDAAETKGHPRRTLGSPLLADHVPDHDALMVERMKAAGCIVIGKTNTPEFGLGSHTFNEVFGVTRNAFDRTKSAGGSSGGAAVALATHMLPVADGSDFMGSLRNPAAWNNVFGFRPSQGRVPRWPAADVWVALLSTEGPMGRTVRDVAAAARRPGRLGRARAAVDRERRSRSRRDSTTSTRAAFASAGSATSTATCRWSPASSSSAHAALARIEARRRHASSRPRSASLPSGSGRPGWSGGAGASPRASRRTSRTRRTAPASSPRRCGSTTRAKQLTGMQTVQACAERTAFHQHMLTPVRALRRARAADRAGLAVRRPSWRWPKTIAGRTMDTYHRWMEVVDLRDASPACRASRAGRLRRERPADGREAV